MQVPEKLAKIEHATLRAWLNRLRDAVQARTLISAPGYRASLNSGGQSFNFDKKGGMSGSSSSSSYTGPFAVIKKSDTAVTVVCIADDVTYFQTALIISGLTRQALTANTDVTITTTGYVYAVITHPSTAYVITFANASAIPAQTSTTMYVSLARVTFTDSKIAAIYQEQDGHIYPTQHGRAGG